MSVDKGVYKILIIEDNPGDSALVTDFLQEKIEMPYISYAKSFKEAKNKLSVINDQYDIILLDISLPDKTGAPLIKEIVEMCFATPIIVLTGYEDFTFGLKSLSMGIADYILKDDLSASALYKSIVYTLERKKSTIALEESEKKYSELFHMSPLPMYVSELETSNFLDVNDAFIKHYGYTRDEVLQMNLKDIRPKKEITNPEEGILNDVSKAQKGSLGICNHLKKNGEIIQVDIKNNFIEYKGKDAKVTVATDVTERLRYIKEIEAQNERLKEISWIQSHVVRAPLARLMGLVDIIKDVADNGDEKRKICEYILLSANELDEVIKEITNKTLVAD